MTFEMPNPELSSFSSTWGDLLGVDVRPELFENWSLSLDLLATTEPVWVHQDQES